MVYRKHRFFLDAHLLNSWFTLTLQFPFLDRQQKAIQFISLIPQNILAMVYNIIDGSIKPLLIVVNHTKALHPGNQIASRNAILVE